MTKPIVSRFAPSPTGFLHIGGVRTALFAYLAAKQTKGTFILRIEDTDKAREVEGSIGHIMESLRWIGIEWDFGPDKPGSFGSCIQSQRLQSYKKYAEILIEKGLAYPDPYTQEEVQVFRQAATDAKLPFLMRNHRPTQFEVWDGTKPLRLKVPEIKRYTWQDDVYGELSAGPEMLDDIILIKSDGYPTYNFAHIIDDYEMGVTHIMRADEFIASTPKFLSIYDALEIPYPVFVTLPPILRDDRTKKLGKRDGAKDILDYRNEGYLPEVMMNFLALVGWNPGTEQEIFSKEELIAAFDTSKIQKSGGAFNEEKLLWMNKQYLEKLSDEAFSLYIEKFIPESVTVQPQFSLARLQRLLPTVRERIQVGNDFIEQCQAGEYDFAFAAPAIDLSIIKWKNDETIDAVVPRLQEVHRLLTEADFSVIDSIKDAVWTYAETTGKGEVLWPLRVTLSGKAQSPDPFTCAYILDKEETLARIASTITSISQNS